LSTFTLTEVDADARRRHVEHRRGGGDRHRFLHACRFQLEVERQFLTDRDRHRGVLDGAEAALLRLDGVHGRLEVADEEVALIVGQGAALFAGPLVLAP
jgi:hypothetical protein